MLQKQYSLNVNDTTIYVSEPEGVTGCLPGLFYFAASGKNTLTQEPFCQPVEFINRYKIRVYSLDLPFHKVNDDTSLAIPKWIQAWNQDSNFFTLFLNECEMAINHLIHLGLLDINTIAVAGLSRGGFVAHQLAAKLSLIHTVVTFAPLTSFQVFIDDKNVDLLQNEKILKFESNHLVDLLSQKSIRLFIGNKDDRVNTDKCYEFFRLLVDSAIKKGIKSPPISLEINPSVGHKGHGTLPFVFEKGMNWLANQLKLDLLPSQP